MSEKVTPETIKKYATEFCAITLATAYNGKETLNGHELLKLTPVKKINQHIVARLSTYWNNQIQSFNSPYFDFEADEVKAALEHFSNVVSQHISLRREHLQPWLLDIVEKTLAPITAATVLTEAEETLIQQFSTVHPLVVSRPQPEPPRVAKSVSFFDSIETAPDEKPAPDQAPVVQAAPMETPRPAAAVVADATPAQPLLHNRPESINSRYKADLPAHSHDVNYGSVKIKLENIGQNISLAQRFMFVGQLFGGDFEAFSQSIRTLDESGDLEAAQNFITGTLADRYNWDLKNEAVTELIALTKRRFG
ncbi:hypothetical protein GCM10023091_02940 [Ravibacter arvi]|uniref:Uncharacterized protein n=1 Tax=Ravibacter arvi TaxID=2051041 RepID=A0ABP8LNY0_9BACT